MKSADVEIPLKKLRALGMNPFGVGVSQRGQMLIETILLMIVLVGMTLMVSNFFKREELIKKVISGPWQNLAGMIQNGVWAPPAQGMRSHPNSYGRHISLKGADAQ